MCSISAQNSIAWQKAAASWKVLPKFKRGGDRTIICPDFVQGTLSCCTLRFKHYTSLEVFWFVQTGITIVGQILGKIWTIPWYPLRTNFSPIMSRIFEEKRPAKVAELILKIAGRARPRIFGSSIHGLASAIVSVSAKSGGSGLRTTDAHPRSFTFQSVCFRQRLKRLPERS